jgi:hypothetical protein
MIGILKQRVFQARQKSADRHVHAMDLREQHSQRTPPICGSVSGGPRWTALCIGVLGHLAAAHDTVGRDGVVPQHFDERLSHVVGMHHAVAAGTHLLWVISMSPNRRLTLLVGHFSLPADGCNGYCSESGRGSKDTLWALKGPESAVSMG